MLTEREHKALDAISIAGPAGLGVLAIGRAAVRGERLTASDKHRIGRTVANALVEDGLIRARADRYVIPPWF